MSFDQAAALADGEVSMAEMRAALDAAVGCLAELGVSASVVPLADDGGLDAGWRFDLRGGAEASAALVSCRAATVDELERVFLASGIEPETMATRFVRLRDCLAERGYELSSEADLVEIVSVVEPADLSGCDAETRGSTG